MCVCVCVPLGPGKPGPPGPPGPPEGPGDPIGPMSPLTPVANQNPVTWLIVSVTSWEDRHLLSPVAILDELAQR